MASADVAQKAPPRKAHHKKTTEQTPLPPYQPRTLSPLPLEQMPAVPPQVAYTAGQLTIVAHNSTLVDVLRAVHAQTGAELDVPSNATERVVASLGPGPAREVLATLLNGTHFNYVMLGTPANPDSVQRLVLTAKSGPDPGPAGTVTAQAPPPGAPPNRFQVPINVPQQNADQDTEDNAADAQDEPAEAPVEDHPDQPQAVPPEGPKTPEQLLQELQRQQQQMQQQQQPGQPNQSGQPQMAYPNPQSPPDN
jgi:hypothetical protein